MTQPRILFVDDDYYEMLGLIERLEAEGMQVITATTVPEALDKSKEQPDLIISDLIMPRVSEATLGDDRYVGVNFCKTMKARFPSCPIIVLTVVSDPAVLAKARAYADDIMVKPVIPRELIHHVRQCLNWAGPPRK